MPVFEFLGVLWSLVVSQNCAAIAVMLVFGVLGQFSSFTELCCNSSDAGFGQFNSFTEQ